MKLTITKPTEIEADSISVVLPVRYDEEQIPNDFPLRKGDTWRATIDLETGMIREWKPEFGARQMSLKVVDEGCYYLLCDCDGSHIVEREQQYVPAFFPGDHYGDYVRFKIGADGRIADWRVSAEELVEAFFPDED
jgi:hypothetical protein